jgi:hypothetical protein
LFEEAMHGPHFTGRATGDVQKRQEFVRAPALEALGDIIRDGESGTLHLIAQTSVATEGIVTCEGVGSPGQLNSRLPYGKIFEACIFHGVSWESQIKFKSSNFRCQIAEVLTYEI